MNPTFMLESKNLANLAGHQLESVWISHPRIEPHPAWMDASTPLLQSCFVNLVVKGMPVLQIVPAEVEIPGKYPALGIEFEVHQTHPSAGHWYDGNPMEAIAAQEVTPYLPSTISQAKVWDALGEGPNSALALALANGVTLTIRHIYPPMILGIEITNAQAKT